jgi:hypothetical protein
MPQLDINTYLTNFFWLIVVFFIFYVLVLKVFLPILIKNFIFRKYFLDLNIQNVLKYKNKAELVMQKFQFLEAFVLTSLNFLFLENLNYIYSKFYMNNYLMVLDQYLNSQFFFDFVESKELDNDFLVIFTEEEKENDYNVWY